MKTYILAVMLSLTAGILAAQNRADYVQSLVPLAVQETPGAFGSVWVTNQYVHNSGTTTVTLLHSNPTCSIGVCPDYFSVSSGETNYLFIRPSGQGEPPGQLVYTPTDQAANVWFNVRFSDLSREEFSAGTEVPVVPETDFAADTIELFDIPVAEKFRQSLRVYDMSESEAPLVRIRIYPLLGQSVLADAELALARDSRPEQWTFRVYPSYAQDLWLAQTYPAIQSEQHVRVELTAITPGMRFWAFAAVANNDTQQVTTITPRRAK